MGSCPLGGAQKYLRPRALGSLNPALTERLNQKFVRIVKNDENQLGGNTCNITPVPGATTLKNSFTWS